MNRRIFDQLDPLDHLKSGVVLLLEHAFLGDFKIEMVNSHIGHVLPEFGGFLIFNMIKGLKLKKDFFGLHLV